MATYRFYRNADGSYAVVGTLSNGKAVVRRETAKGLEKFEISGVVHKMAGDFKVVRDTLRGTEGTASEEELAQ